MQVHSNMGWAYVVDLHHVNGKFTIYTLNIVIAPISKKGQENTEPKMSYVNVIFFINKIRAQNEQNEFRSWIYKRINFSHKLSIYYQFVR